MTNGGGFRYSESPPQHVHGSLFYANYWLIVGSSLVIPFCIGLWWHGTFLGGISGLLMGGLLRMFMVVNSTFTISLDPFDLHGMFPGGTMLPHGPSDPYHLADGIAMIEAIGYYCGLMALSYHMMPGEHNGGEKHYG